MTQWWTWGSLFLLIPFIFTKKIMISYNTAKSKAYSTQFYFPFQPSGCLNIRLCANQVNTYRSFSALQYSAYSRYLRKTFSSWGKSFSSFCFVYRIFTLLGKDEVKMSGRIKLDFLKHNILRGNRLFSWNIKHIH